MFPAERKFVIPVPKSKIPSYFNAARAHCEIGFTRIGEQDPYFHALAGIEGRLRNNRWEGQLGRFACCADHDALREHFPKYAHLIRWHLASIATGPMHYEANAVYWAEMATGVREVDQYLRRDPVEVFKDHVAFGSVATDEGEPWKIDEDALRAWLRERFPAMMAAFKADIDRTFPDMWEAALKLPPGRF